MTWPLKPAKKGKVAVAKGRGGPLQISYEIHGNGPMKLVVGIMIPFHFPLDFACSRGRYCHEDSGLLRVTNTEPVPKTGQ